MAKTALTFSQSLNLAFSVLLVIGGGVTYKYGNFGGVSYDELTEKYISKTDVKFSDLPQEMQKNYIDKEATIEQSKDGNLFEDAYYDDQGRQIPESELTKQDLKRMINRLQKTLLFLQHDNLLVANEKNELAKKLEEQQTDVEDQQKQWSHKNTELLNEAEQQHYRNIADLTARINELQKEGVINAQKSNLEANALRSQIEELKAKAIEEEGKKTQAIQKAREEEQSKLVDYKEKIKFLNDQVSLLNEQMNTNTETAKNAFLRKQEEIDKLKTEINQGIKERNELMAKRTNDLLLADQKHKEEIATYNKTIEQLKKDTEKLIAQNRQDMALQDEENTKKLALQEEKTKVLLNELSNAKKHIDSLMLESEKDFNKFRTYLEDEKRLNKELTQANKALEDNAQALEKSMNASMLKLKEEGAKKDVVIKELNDKIAALKQETINVEAEVKKRVEENEKIHNKNYRLFNEKIATIETYKKELADKFEKQKSEYQAIAKENNDRLQIHITELTNANNEIKQKNDEKDKELQSLKTQWLAYKNETQKSKETDDGKLKELRAALEDTKAIIKQKEEEYLTKIQALNADIKTKEVSIVASKKEDALKVAELEKEIKTKAIELQKLRTENAHNEGLAQTLQVKLKDAEDNTTKATNKQVEELKAKLAQIEKNRISEDAKMVSIKDELRRKEIEYLDALKEKDKELKAKETSILANKEETKKVEAAKKTSDESLAKLKDELKQKELQYLETIKTLQADIKTKDAQLNASNKEETLKSVALEKELRAKEATINANKENYKKTEAIKASLEENVVKLKEELKQKELQHLEAVKSLQAELKTKDTQLNGSKKDETLRIAALEKELKAKEGTLAQLQEENTKKLASSDQAIKTLNEKIKLLESTTPKQTPTKVASTTSKSHKLTAIDQVTCTDMGTGVNAISEGCKKEVQSFLAKYDTSYFFEVTPIVDNGGFASLKMIKSKKVGVEDAEIDRITGLANVGLGKARAKAGGDLIQSYVGDSAKISYSLTNIEQDKARGFQIKVYQ